MSGLARERIVPLLRDGDRCAMAVAVAGALLVAGTLTHEALHPPAHPCGTSAVGALLMELALLAGLGVALALLRAAATHFDSRPVTLAYVGLATLALIPLAALDTLIATNLVASLAS